MIFPLILFLISAGLDAGRSLHQYMLLTRISYEGGRYAASRSGLVPGSPQTEDCIPGPQNPVCSEANMAVRNRIKFLLTEHGFDLNQGYSLVTQVVSMPNGNSNQYLTVKIDTAVNLNRIFPFRLPGLGIVRHKVTAPYLFPDSNGV